MTRVRVNGEPLDSGAEDLAALVRELGFRVEGVAVAVNGQVVPRATLAATPPNEGDVIEVIRAVGGG